MNRISQAALRHRAGIRRLMPKGLHHLAGTLARRFVQAAESTDLSEADFAAKAAAVQFPAPLLPGEAFHADRVILVNDALASGGAERQIVNTLVGLKSRSPVEASLLCWRLGETPELDFFAGDLERAGIPFANVAELEPHPEPDGVRNWLDASLDWVPRDVRDRILRLVAEFVARRPGIVHGWQDETGLITAFAGILAGAPRIVVACRNVNPSGFGYHRPFMRAAYLALARRPEVIFINNSETGARDYETWAGLDAGRFQVLYNGIDAGSETGQAERNRAEARQRLGLPGGDGTTTQPIVIGTVVRFNQEKRPILWVQTAARILEHYPQAHFVMAGDGPMREATRAAARRLGLDRRLHLPGPVRPVEAALAAMDVFLLSSRFEGLPNVTLEAGLAGLPVVTTDAGGARETIRIGETGLVVPEVTGAGELDEPRLADALSDAVCGILRDEAFLERARRLGPDFVRQRFGMDRMIERTMALYTAGSTRSPADYTKGTEE